MERSRAQRSYEAIVRSVQVPIPFNMADFCTRVAQYLVRPLRLHPIQIGSLAGFCGLYVEVNHVDHVYFPTHTSPIHQQHIVLHELAHLLCGHRGSRQTWTMPDGLVGKLFPNLDSRVVRAALGRSRYADPEEREAETVASLILERAQNVRDTAGDPVAAQIESALG